MPQQIGQVWHCGSHRGEERFLSPLVSCQEKISVKINEFYFLNSAKGPPLTSINAKSSIMCFYMSSSLTYFIYTDHLSPCSRNVMMCFCCYCNCFHDQHIRKCKQAHSFLKCQGPLRVTNLPPRKTRTCKPLLNVSGVLGRGCVDEYVYHVVFWGACCCLYFLSDLCVCVCFLDVWTNTCTMWFFGGACVVCNSCLTCVCLCVSPHSPPPTRQVIASSGAESDGASRRDVPGEGEL